MIPILYDSSETAFTTNGLGPLSDAIECTVEEEINGVYQLRMIYPIDGFNFSNIKALNIIKVVPAPEWSARPQPFDIVRVSMPRHDRVEIYARHISYRLCKNTVLPFSLSSATVGNVLTAIKNHRVEDDGFSFSTSFLNVYTPFAVAEPCSIRQALGDLLNVLGKGEYIWNLKTVGLHETRGTNTDITLRYGVNIIDFKQEQNIEETITGIVPYWKGRDTDGNDVVVTLSQPAVYSSNANRFPYARTVPVDFSSEFKEKPTESQLLSAAQSYISANGVGTPKVSIDVSFVNLSDTEEYKAFTDLGDVSLGDTINVNYAKLGVTAQARVIRTVYDVLKDRYTEISLGDTKIRGQSAQSAVAPVKKEVSQINNAVNAITEFETALITLPSSFTNNSVQRNFYYRKGNICMIGFDCTPSARVSAVTMFTLPTACRPVKALRLSALPSLSRETDDGDTQYVSINTDGTVNYTGSARLCQVYTFICKGG